MRDPEDISLANLTSCCLGFSTFFSCTGQSWAIWAIPSLLDRFYEKVLECRTVCRWSRVAKSLLPFVPKISTQASSCFYKLLLCSKNSLQQERQLLAVSSPFLPFEIRILSAGLCHRSNTCWPWKSMSACVFVFTVVLNEDSMYRCRCCFHVFPQPAVSRWMFGMSQKKSFGSRVDHLPSPKICGERRRGFWTAAARLLHVLSKSWFGSLSGVLFGSS